MITKLTVSPLNIYRILRGYFYAIPMPKCWYFLEFWRVCKGLEEELARQRAKAVLHYLIQFEEHWIRTFVCLEKKGGFLS